MYVGKNKRKRTYEEAIAISQISMDDILNWCGDSEEMQLF